MLEECQKGTLDISTSTLTIGEVAFAAYEKIAGQVEPSTEQRIDSLWLPATKINLVEVSEFVIRDARAGMRAGLPSNLRPKLPDAIHLATAKRVGADEFHTYDDLGKYSSLFGITVKEPIPIQLPLPDAGPIGLPKEPNELQADSDVSISQTADVQETETASEVARPQGEAVEDKSGLGDGSRNGVEGKPAPGADQAKA